MKTTRRPNRRRLSVDIPDVAFNQLVERCKERETTITKYVIGAIVQRLAQEQKYNQ